MYQRNGAVSIAQLSRPEPKKNLRFKGLIIRAVLSQRPFLTWHSSKQWRKKKKTEVEETRSAVQHASLYLVFLPRKSPSNRSLYGCINYFFPPDFRYNSAKNPCPLDRGVIQPWVWYSSPALNPSFERCIRLDTQRTQELILSIWMIFKHWFAKCDEKTSDEIRHLLNIRYFKYNFQLICEISVLKRGQMIFISKQW